MSYQITEQNQILVALFAIVVLCAGKLFKDYLYRRGYVEGLTVVPGTNVPLRREAVGGNPLIATLSLNLTLGATLATGGTITVSWPVTTGVTMPTTPESYTATIVSNVPSTSSATISRSTSGTIGTTVVFALAGGSLDSGSKLRISMAGVSIAAGDPAIGLNFNTITSAETKVVPISFQILKSTDTTSGLQGSASAQEIRTAIATINTRLNASPSPSTEEQTSLINARSALVNVLAYTYGTIQEAGKVFDSDALYEAQKTAIKFIAKERERAKKNAESLTQDNSNKRRMAQVNTYYTRNYEANTEVMKNIIYVSVALIALAVLRNKELIPASISTLGVIFVLTMGGIVIGKQVFDIMRRNDHEFDKYDWNFNEDDMNKKFVQPSSDPSKSIDLGLGGACYGPGCCDVGTTWDAGRGLCASSGGALSSQGSSAVWTTGTLTIIMKISQALASGDTVSITLPLDVFTTSSNAVFTSAALASSPVSKSAQEIASKISLPVVSAGFAATAPITLTITGITVSPNADKRSFQNVIVSTSKEPTPISLRISGLLTA
jgi:hypothetical protein